MRIRAKTPHLAGFLVVFAVGCVVSESKYQAKSEELELCQSARDDLMVERNALRGRVPKLEGQLQEQQNATKEELEALRKQREELDEQLAEYRKLTERFKEMVATEGIKVDVRRGRMIVSLPSSVLFPSGSAEVSKRGAATLAKVASKLEGFKNRRFIVAGHTDNVPIGDSGKVEFADNWELSTARALRVVRFLIEQGLDPKSLAATGYGQYDPLRSNRRKGGRRLNRRIELIIEPNLPDFRKLARLARKVQTTPRSEQPQGSPEAPEGAPKGSPDPGGSKGGDGE